MTPETVEEVAKALWDSYQLSEIITEAWKGLSWDTICRHRGDNDGAKAVYETGIAEAQAAISHLESLGWKPQAWLPIESAPKGVKLIAGYRNSLGKWRSVMARYYLPGTLDSAEGNETEDGFAEEGWYEESETHETLMPTDHPPTHWQPLPTSPTEEKTDKP